MNPMPTEGTRIDGMTKNDDGRWRNRDPLDAKAFLPPAYFVGAVLFFLLALLATFL